MNKYTIQIVENWREIEKQKLNAHVKINYDKLKQWAQNNFNQNLAIPDWREKGVSPEFDFAFASFQMFVSALNFGFNDPRIAGAKYQVGNPNDSGKPYTGSTALERRIYEIYGEKIIHASHLRRLFCSRAEEVSAHLEGINKIPFPDLRFRCGVAYMHGLEINFQGNPLNLLEEATASGVDGKPKLVAFREGEKKGKGFVELLMNSFDGAFHEPDYSLYGFTFQFVKKAQLAAILIHGRAVNSARILPSFLDIDEVGPLADYQVPRALRALGILEYSPELKEKVDHWKLIVEGSSMEVEIRAATVAACCKIIDEINQYRRDASTSNWMATKENLALDPINICHLDGLLWNAGRKAKSYPHLCKTKSY